MGFLSKLRIKANEIYEDSYEFLQKTYDQARSVFTPASPFGQVLTVVSNLGELIFFYIEAALTELNIKNARNIENIQGIARLTGHDAFRGYSARGYLGLKLNTMLDSIEGDYLQINNHTPITFEDNGLDYFINLKSDYIRLSKSSRDFVNVEIIQGKIENQTLTSTGESLMSFSIITGGMVDHDFITVKVNDETWKKKESLYDMLANEKSYLIKTGINGGLDLYFGNGSFGMIPEQGASIEVTYVKCDGYYGNLDSKSVKIRFNEAGTDYQGNDIDLNECLVVNVVTQPIFGSNPESSEFTRLIAPHASKSFVLANPENYIYYLSRYDMFSFIDAYNTKDDKYLDDDNVVYLTLVPNIKKKITSDIDYFNIDTNEFKLSDFEKESILTILDKSGRQLATSEVVINDIKLKRYILNVVVRYFEGYSKDEINTNIRKCLNDYFLNINRRDRVPKSDLIAILEKIKGIDSVNIFFISEENETAIKNGFYIKNVYYNDPYTGLSEWKEEQQMLIDKDNDPHLGLDSFGDIVIGINEIAVIRGGFEDRNGNYYEETPTNSGLGSLNIFFTESVDPSIYNTTQQSKFNELLKSKGIN